MEAMSIESIVSKIERSVNANLGIKKSLVLGVNGLDCSGKTTIANALLKSLGSVGVSVGLLHVDDYNDQPFQKDLYTAYESGRFDSESLDEYYCKSVVYEDLAKAIISHKKTCSVLIVEGVFLFKKCLGCDFDIKVFVEVDPLLARRRYQERKTKLGDQRPVEVFDDIWLPAYQRYLRGERPVENADIVVQN